MNVHLLWGSHNRVGDGDGDDDDDDDGDGDVHLLWGSDNGLGLLPPLALLHLTATSPPSHNRDQNPSHY